MRRYTVRAYALGPRRRRFPIYDPTPQRSWCRLVFHAPQGRESVTFKAFSMLERWWSLQPVASVMERSGLSLARITRRTAVCSPASGGFVDFIFPDKFRRWDVTNDLVRVWGLAQRLDWNQRQVRSAMGEAAAADFYCGAWIV